MRRCGNASSTDIMLFLNNIIRCIIASRQQEGESTCKVANKLYVLFLIVIVFCICISREGDNA
jgi:hypothetical protein